MKITSIKQQIKQGNRYSIFVDGRYEFSLSDTLLLENKLVGGQELTAQQLKQLKQLSDYDKLYALVLRYATTRLRSRWEMEYYLQRKKVSPTLSEQILNKLSIIGLLDDEKFARAFVEDRRLLRPSSRRKIMLELRNKRVADQVIQKVLGNEPGDEQTALREIIERKRRQTRYQDEQKIMQYLARQGFSYADIKSALSE